MQANPDYWQVNPASTVQAANRGHYAGIWCGRKWPQTRSNHGIGWIGDRFAHISGIVSHMAVPRYQAFLLPVLQFAVDGDERSNRDTIEAMAERFAMSADERAERIPSGRQSVLDNRISWAQTYLRQAGLIESTHRAHFRITGAGKAVLANPPAHIDVSFLLRFPAFAAFKSRVTPPPTSDGATTPTVSSPTIVLPVATQTPEEVIADACRDLRTHLATELLEHVMQCSPAFFERLVVDLLRAMGYGGASTSAGRVTGRSGDGGIDGIITEDKLGLDAVYLQAKRWSGNVGRPTVQEFAGAMQGHKADKGVIITTSEFTADARDYVRTISTRIVLIGGRQLVDLMIDHDVGVRIVETHVVRRVDGDYFEGS